MPSSRKFLFLILTLLFLSSLISANIPSTITGSTTPRQALLSQTSYLLPIIGALLLIMVVLAAAAYVAGQFFGADTRARANAWSMSMLAGIGVGIAILTVMYLILPGILNGDLSLVSLDPSSVLGQVLSLLSSGLQILIVSMVIIAAMAYAAGSFFGGESRARATGWSNTLIAGAMVCAVIYLLLTPIVGSNGLGIFNNTYLSQYSSLIIEVIYTITLIILITYGASKLLKQPEWEAYLSLELSNLMSSFLVVLFVIGLFIVGTAITAPYLPAYGPTATTPPKAAIVYLQVNISQTVFKALYDVNSIQVCTSVLGTFQKRLGEQVLTETYKLFPGTDMLVAICNTVIFSLGTVLGSVSAQISFLYLVDAVMLNFFLPAGLVLRFIPPTRDAGSFLIALSFGFQFVYPLTYLVNAQAMSDIGLTSYQVPATLIATICGPLKFATFGYVLNTGANPIYSAIPALSSLAPALQTLFSETTLNAVSMAEFLQVLQQVAWLSLPALFMPALSMMITIAFINTMSKFLISKM